MSPTARRTAFESSLPDELVRAGLLAVAFAFPNESGTRLLTTASLDARAVYQTALLLPARRARLPMLRLSRERSGCRFGGPRRIRAVFARRLSSALASLVVIDGDRRLYIDFPAEFRGPGADLWRADDGGEIHPEGFEVVFPLKRADAYVLGIDWKGAEGSAPSICGAEPGAQFKEVLTDFWYRSPL